jgi:truncated hemoglobin YjbI
VPTLYESIGDQAIRDVITEFYTRAFDDPIIGHFFFGKDRLHLIGQQIAFATSMLGGPARYRGKSLIQAHEPFEIRGPHFARRQVLMRQVLDERTTLPEATKAAWLKLEEQLRPLIVNS